MISRREIVAFIAAAVVIVFSDTFGLGLLTFVGVWMMQIAHEDNRSAERRYRMRETERRNHENS